MNYFYVLKGKIARLDKNSHRYDLRGFCADHIVTGNIIIIASQDKNRYVMMHADLSLNHKAILSQLAWAGDGATLKLFKKKQNIADANLVQNYLLAGMCCDEELIPDNKQAVVLDIVSGMSSVQDTLPASVCFHPDSKIMTAYHHLEYLSGYAYQVSQRKIEIYRDPVILNSEYCPPFSGYAFSETTQHFFSCTWPVF